MLNQFKNQDHLLNPEKYLSGDHPPEPKKFKLTKGIILRSSVFLVFIIYILLSHYHESIFVNLGRYLVEDHPLQKSDLIVCLGGSNIERGLETADVYNKGFAPRIFMAREKPEEGYALLKERGVDYPETNDLLKTLLQNLGVSQTAIITNDTVVDSTWEEAEVVRDVVKNGGYRSIIVVTSPFHSRRAWVTYRKVFEDMDTQIRMRCSKYSSYNPEEWWKSRRFLRTVTIEYQKFGYYIFKYLF